MNPILLRIAVIVGALVIWFWTQRLIARKIDEGLERCSQKHAPW